MSAAAAAAKPDAKGEEAPKKGKKKLIILIVVALLLVGGGAGGWAYWSKKQAAEAAAAAAEEEDEDDVAPKRAAKKGKSTPPTFMSLDMFTLNLADKGTERFLQLGVSLELIDAKAADEIKAYMPAIRNNILMVVSTKASTDIQSEEGKRTLAREIQGAALAPLGFELEDDEEVAKPKDSDDEKPAKKKKKKKRAKPEYPVVAVHFSNFIIQ